MIMRLKNYCKSEKFVKDVKNFAVMFAYVIIAIALMSNFGFADDGDATEITLFTEVSNILEVAQGYLLTLSGTAVIIAVGCGVFIKKFSMGKQDKIELGNKLIRDSIIAFLVLNSMPIIVPTIKKLINGEITSSDVTSKDEALLIIDYVKNLF